MSNSDAQIDAVAAVIAGQIAATLDYGEVGYTREQAASVNDDTGWTVELTESPGSPARRETVRLTAEELDLAYQRAQALAQGERDQQV